MIEIKNLNVKLEAADKSFNILKDINLVVKKGEVLGIAGESGSGKTILAKTIMNLISRPVVKTSGRILVDGQELNTEKEFAKIRGNKISMIFQNPTASLNPVIKIGDQIIETIRTHDKKISKKDAHSKGVDLLRKVEITYPEERMNSFPHQLSGGMNQRVMIAMALASDPELLIADEPTTALDVTIQKQIIDLLKKLNKENELAIIFITHDLALLELIAEKSIILYSGEIMEILKDNYLGDDKMRHPYTKSLKKCVPAMNKDREFLETIPGTISPNTDEYDDCCIFKNRCYRAEEKCSNEKPKLENGVKCFFPD